MRITKNFLMTAAFAFLFTALNANTNPNFDSARQEIETLMTKAEVFKYLDEDMTIHVTFQINSKNEIIIISTDQEKYDDNIKYTLNYQKLESTDMKINTNYTLPIVLKK